jgi:hypothetical protein
MHGPTLRALVETVLPGSPDDPTPGAVQAGADRLLADVLSRIGADAADGVVGALDGFAGTVREGAAFCDLSPDERSRVLEVLAREQDPLVQGLVRLVFSISVAATYGQWEGAWEHVGYPGPSARYELERRA